MKRRSLLAVVPLLVVGLSTTLQATPRNARAMAVAGMWDCVAHGGRNGDIPFTLHLHGSGAKVTGWVSSSLGDADITTARFRKGALEIHIDTDRGNYLIAGKLSHGKLAGHWSHESEKGSWEGHRAKTPKQ